MELEKSNFASERLAIEPRLLLCLACRKGGGSTPYEDKVKQLQERIEQNPELHLTLTGAFDEVGARTELFAEQTAAERRKDLDVLQRLGLCFTDTRSARDLLARIAQLIPDLTDICSYLPNQYGTWPECPLARQDYYKKGNQPLAWAQAPDVMARYKESSCRELAQADTIVIRAHHLLCVICYAGSENNDIPLPEDNLMEAWVRFRENPDLPVKLVEGPQECCICPPCHGYVQDRGLCVAACHLRDRKKDLDFCVVTGTTPGQTYTARELYQRIATTLADNSPVCGYPDDTSAEWTSCNSTGSERYKRGFQLCVGQIAGQGE